MPITIQLNMVKSVALELEKVLDEIFQKWPDSMKAENEVLKIRQDRLRTLYWTLQREISKCP